MCQCMCVRVCVCIFFFICWLWPRGFPSLANVYKSEIGVAYKKEKVWARREERERENIGPISIYNNITHEPNLGSTRSSIFRVLGALNLYYKSDKIFFFFFYVEKRKTFDSNIFVGQGEQKKSGKILRNYDEKNLRRKKSEKCWMIGKFSKNWRLLRL